MDFLKVCYFCSFLIRFVPHFGVTETLMVRSMRAEGMETVSGVPHKFIIFRTRDRAFDNVDAAIILVLLHTHVHLNRLAFFHLDDHPQEEFRGSLRRIQEDEGALPQTQAVGETL